MLNLSIILSFFLLFLGGIQCQAPSAVTFASEFPNWPLNITVTPSTAGIFKYRAIILPQFGGGCRGHYSFNCSDCAGTGGTTGATDTSACPALVNLGSYTSANTVPFTMAITDSSLLPVVAISIKVEAQTAAGYSTNGRQDFTLAAFKSGPVRNVFVNSTNINFTTPAVENGKVQEYILYVRKPNGDCIFTMTFNCTQCTATPGNKNIAFNTSLCSVKKVSQFLGTESLITSTYTLPEPVINCFNVCIVAVNAYGWGEVACSCIDTSPTTPIPTTSLPIDNSTILQSTVNKAPITFSCFFTPYVIPINMEMEFSSVPTKCTIVVSRGNSSIEGKGVSPAGAFVNPSQDQCAGDSCTYEVLINIKDTSLRIGSHSSESGYNKNGELKPSTTYKVAVRCYYNSVYNTSAIIEVSTESETCRNGAIAGIVLLIVAGIAVIFIVIFIVIKKNKSGDKNKPPNNGK